MNEPVSQPVSRLQAPFLPFTALNPSLTFSRWCSLIWKSKSDPPFPSQACFWSEIFSYINRMKPELRVRRPSWWRRSSSLSSALCGMSPVKFECFEVHHFSSLMAQGGTRISLGTSLPVMMITPPLTWVESGLFCISLWKTYLLFFAEN